MNVYLLFIMVAVAIGGMAWVFIYPFLSGERNAERRMASVARTEPMAQRPTRSAQKSRREQVEGTLKQLEARKKTAKRVPLSVRLARAGLDWSPRRFMMIAGALGFVVFVIAISVGVGLLPGLGLGVCGRRRTSFLGFVVSQEAARIPLPRNVSRRRRRDRSRHQGRSAAARQPQADRGRSQEPVRSEFRSIIETQTIGIPIGEACLKLYERMPLPEANFFGIVVSIQQRAGGNLSEALGNLSRVLRDRKKMKAKIQAMSMEAKASAGIIGALPPAVMTLVYITSPQYISLLWTEPLGRMMLAGCAVWMSMGVMVMRKMINFDF